MTDQSAWEARLYDWHNEHRLRAQQADVLYWQTTVPAATRVAVLGGGTGRIASPLCEQGRMVIALDASSARLRRMARLPRLHPVCGDFRALPLTICFDTAIFPYSSFQLLISVADRRRALEEAARVLVPGGLVHIDVSGNFDTKLPTDWFPSLVAPCGAAEVAEWERRTLAQDHIVIDKSFQSQGRILTEAREKWAFLRVLGLETELELAGFELTEISRGYGPDSATHRLIYHGRRRDGE
ncbi:class I SAM-dependent methyltransferase [Streptomyces sp. NBC_01538]|uniref:class I SAM-dependent methyltransferase n=1 Tax=Streptomyces sp. NBC_01538 TaxID=2903897 RepID=UPI003868EB88